MISAVCSAVRCGAVRCGALQYSAVQCGAVRCGAVRCGAVLEEDSHFASSMFAFITGVRCSWGEGVTAQRGEQMIKSENRRLC